MGAGAVEVYAAWAPLGRLADAGLLAACAFLLSTPDFRMTAVDILRVLASRKQAQVCSSRWITMLRCAPEHCQL